MKLKDVVVESKNGKPIVAKRNKSLNDALLARKAGAHYSERLDYKRAKEKQRQRKDVNAELKEDA